MMKRILLALALVGAIAACGSPAASSGVGASAAPPDVSSPDVSSPDTSAEPSVEPSESPAAS
jgi:hypothetical protein